MDCRKLTLIACLSGLLITLSASASNNSGSARCRSVSCKVYAAKQPLTQLSVEQLHQVAHAITVKVLSQDFLGTGILIHKQGELYTVLTNAHVLRAGNPTYRIQTPDGQIYPANLPKSLSFGENDLALLQFRSTGKVYAVGSLGSSPTVGNEVFAAGFPFAEEKEEEKGFVFSTGKVSLLLPKPLEGGYQVGYTNDIEKGMSGGPLLNRRGEVVGVNGMHAYPLWDAPSVFADGTSAGTALHEKIIRLSWAVPMEKVVQILPKAFTKTNQIKLIGD